MNKTKFKVGDLVIVTGTNKQNREFFNKFIQDSPLHIGEIERIIAEDIFSIRPLPFCRGKKSWAFLAEDLRKVGD